jgi:hypothetical protein
MDDNTSLATGSHSDVQEQKPRNNIFRELVPDAKRTLRRTMLMSHDSKLAADTAKDVLDRAGETKKVEEREQRPVVITNSQINLLYQVARELDSEEIRDVSE